MSNYSIKHLEEYYQVYRKSVRDPENFWAEIAEEHFMWRKKWDNILSWDFSKPEIKWFEGAKLNITENCIDRHLATKGDKTAILFEPNSPDEEAQHITYKRLYERVNQMANVLKDHGIQKGDRVCIYFADDTRTCHFFIGLCKDRSCTFRSILRVFLLMLYRLELTIVTVKWYSLLMVLTEVQKTIDLKRYCRCGFRGLSFC